MANRLTRFSFLANRVMAPRSVIPVRGGGGGPLAQPLPPNQPLPEEDELVWDDGTANPETCLDTFDLVTPHQALAFLTAGLSVFGLIGFAAFRSKPEERVPWVPKSFPVDVNAIVYPAKTE